MLWPFGKEDLYRSSQVNLQSSRWALTQQDGCPCTKGTLGQTGTEGRRHEDTQGGGLVEMEDHTEASASPGTPREPAHHQRRRRQGRSPLQVSDGWIMSIPADTLTSDFCPLEPRDHKSLRFEARLWHSVPGAQETGTPAFFLFLPLISSCPGSIRHSFDSLHRPGMQVSQGQGLMFMHLLQSLAFICSFKRPLLEVSPDFCDVQNELEGREGTVDRCLYFHPLVIPLEDGPTLNAILSASLNPPTPAVDPGHRPSQSENAIHLATVIGSELDT